MIAARIPYMTAPGNHGNLIYTLHIICSSIYTAPLVHHAFETRVATNDMNISPNTVMVLSPE